MGIRGLDILKDSGDDDQLRLLLRRYILHVEACEGDDFIHDDIPSSLSTEDQVLLRQIKEGR